jgi:hypothetical protein
MSFQFWHFDISGFDISEIPMTELGNFALKTLKSQNAMCLWSRAVVLEEAAISAFRHFGVWEIEGPRTICSQNCGIVNSEIPKKWTMVG